MPSAGDEALTLLGAGGLVTLFGLLVKVLWKSDDRWLKIITSKDETIHELEAKMDRLEQRDETREAQFRQLQAHHAECERKTSDMAHRIDLLQQQLERTVERPGE